MKLYLSNRTTSVDFDPDEQQSLAEQGWLMSFLTFEDTNNFFTKADGQAGYSGSKRRHLFSQKTSTFPAGLTGMVYRNAMLRGFHVEVTDYRKWPRPALGREMAPWLHDFQHEGCDHLLARTRGVLSLPTGCHRIGQRVMRADGTPIDVERVAVGDRLMGQDWQPRAVLGLCRGRQQMARIVPRHGSPWVVNVDHVLTLLTLDRGLVDIPLRDYVRGGSPPWPMIKVSFGGLVRPVLFSVQLLDGEEDYYGFIVSGDHRYLLDDGTVTHNSGKTELFCGLTLRTPDVRWLLLAPEADLMINAADRYKLRTGEEAGMLGDGKESHEDRRVVCATFQTVGRRLADPLKRQGMLDLLASFQGVVVDECFPAGTMVTTPGGECPIESIRVGDLVQSYHEPSGSFGPRRVTQVFQRMACDLVRVNFRSGRQVVCTPGHPFLTPGGWVVASRLAGLEVLQCDDVGSREVPEDAVPGVDRVESVEVLEQGGSRRGDVCAGCTVYNFSVEETETYLVEGLVVHNCHQAPADQNYGVLTAMPNAFYRCGLSGTALSRTDRRNMYTLAAIGDQIYEVPARVLMERGFIARPTIRFVPHVVEPPKNRTYVGAYRESIVRSKARNDLLASVAMAAAKPCLVFVKQEGHGKELLKLLKARGAKVEFIYGKHSTSEREQAIKRLSWGDTEIAICTKIWQTGTDIPDLRSLVIGTSGASAIEAIQRVGRALRVVRDKEGKIIKGEADIWDIWDQDAREMNPETGRLNQSRAQWFTKHSKERRQHYMAQGYPVEMLDPADCLRMGIQLPLAKK